MAEIDSKPVVCVFGSAGPVEGSAEFQAAYEAGRELALLGYVVANGGYAGTMLASARGAKEAHGATIGVTCKLWSTKPNGFLDQIIETENLTQRGCELVGLGSGGFVVLDGATGTLLELATVWEFMAKNAMKTVPIVCVGSFWQPVADTITSVAPKAGKFVQFVDTADQLDLHFPQVEKAV